MNKPRFWRKQVPSNKQPMFVTNWIRTAELPAGTSTAVTTIIATSTGTVAGTDPATRTTTDTILTITTLITTGKNNGGLPGRP